jgi:hypothetical protein
MNMAILVAAFAADTDTLIVSCVGRLAGVPGQGLSFDVTVPFNATPAVINNAIQTAGVDAAALLGFTVGALDGKLVFGGVAL